MPMPYAPEPQYYIHGRPDGLRDVARISTHNGTQLLAAVLRKRVAAGLSRQVDDDVSAKKCVSGRPKPHELNHSASLVFSRKIPSAAAPACAAVAADEEGSRTGRLHMGQRATTPSQRIKHS